LTFDLVYTILINLSFQHHLQLYCLCRFEDFLLFQSISKLHFGVYPLSAITVPPVKIAISSSIAFFCHQNLELWLQSFNAHHVIYLLPKLILLHHQHLLQ
jgi:hypothetical protein